MVDESDERKEDGLPGGSFDDGGFADSCRIKIYVGALFGCLGSDIKV